MDLLSNDCQRIEYAPRMTCISFFFVFDIVVIFFIVVFLMGWQGLIGVVFMTALLPCVLIISVACAKLRRETAEVSEKRISLMNELVTGIRALKTHTWEEYYEEKVKEVRRWEGVRSSRYRVQSFRCIMKSICGEVVKSFHCIKKLKTASKFAVVHLRWLVLVFSLGESIARASHSTLYARDKEKQKWWRPAFFVQVLILSCEVTFGLFK